MEIKLLAVGRLRPFYREACDEYLRRLKRYADVSEREIRESRRTGTIGETNQDEAKRLLEKLPPRATVIGLTRNGSLWTSSDLAERLRQWLVDTRSLVFAIGGSTGLDETLLSRSQHRWSLGPLTLPHELARVVVYEQLYRAFTILKGEPYHKSKT